MAVTTVELWGEVIGDPETGVWCPMCSLPSAVRVHAVIGTHLSVLADNTYRHCYECNTMTLENQ